MKKVCIFSSNSQKAKKISYKLKQIFGEAVTPPQEADAFIALGGDGFMLHVLHKFRAFKKPVYGLNCGTLGFLMNPLPEKLSLSLLDEIFNANTISLRPLRATLTNLYNETKVYNAINEVSLLRATSQAIKFSLSINNNIKINELVGDGLVVSTPTGSTAYNFSANGPILPLHSNLLSIAPLSIFRPRFWRGALVPDTTEIQIDILEPGKRQLNVSVDAQTVPLIKKIKIKEHTETHYEVLFSKDYNLQERIMKEQFLLAC